MQAPPERLGAFYLGAEIDPATGEQTETPINYDARDLTTHAVCVGMTGSGKTGLCIGLLEEAAIDKVPALIIDPKGDLTNLLLQFPDLLPSDFRPWINADDARRKGQTVDEFAEATAGTWRKGLADWGQGPERVQMLKDSVDYTVYTPGSDAGVPVSILGSLAAPKLSYATDAEAIRDRIAGTTSALLGLVGIDADPVRSREAILLSNIFDFYWRQGENLDLSKLILAIQTPPVRQVGVFDVDTFFPQKDRFGLAMAFNNLMAAPTFQSWLEGDPLDIDRLFYTAEGKPRHSIFYIAHLSDSERMFFVTLLLESLVTWMRGQTGTTSLRALLYFDEIFGFFPPVQEPPSKKPLLTLLKQARAFGLGAVLVTQNPVDIDYKGLTNAGTWFIGKLQAERDKDRVLQGLKGAIAEAGRSSDGVDYDTLITALSSRVFLMHNVHEDGPVVFQTRWAMSYLRGPLTRPQVKELMAPKKAALAAQAASHVEAAPAPPVRQSAQDSAPAVTASAAAMTAAPLPAQPAETDAPKGFSSIQAALDPSVAQAYLPVDMSRSRAVKVVADDAGRAIDVKRVQMIYEPAVLGAATVSFLDRAKRVDEKQDFILLSPVSSGAMVNIDWARADALPLKLSALERGPSSVAADEGPYFAPVPEEINTERELRAIASDLTDWLYANKRLTITTHASLGIHQQPGESDRAFRIRLQDAARQQRDAEVDKLKGKYRTQMDRLQDKLGRTEKDLAQDQAELSTRKTQEMVNIGESVLGFFLGRRSSRTLSSVVSKRGMTAKAKGEIERTQEEIAELQSEIQGLEKEMEIAADEITRKWAEILDDLTSEEVKPRRTDVDVEFVAVGWMPSWLVTYHDGIATRRAAVPAYALPVQETKRDES
ncbi:MAG: DUF87 domain-containing protein [Chloroflexi bacterium]|nr:MAG: DUF87 domain-containing protein [Chloroflexota bacterium]